MARPPAPRTSHDDRTAGQVAVATPPPSAAGGSALVPLLAERSSQVLEAWVLAQTRSTAFRSGLLSEAEVRDDSFVLLNALSRAVVGGNSTDLAAPDFAEVRKLVATMSKDRARQGYSPSETTEALFLLKEVLGTELADLSRDSAEALAREILALNGLVDRVGLLAFDAYVAGREEVIKDQQRSMLELSTPVVKLWDGIVAVPLIGTLDSGRTQMVMESLLQAIVDTGSQVAIIDITGVSMVDTLVAQHLLKTVAATRLMGADCIISGIRPQIAQTMVHLGVDLAEVVTKATLADAFRFALRRVGSDLGSSPQR